jgi:hypothetical protein
LDCSSERDIDSHNNTWAAGGEGGCDGKACGGNAGAFVGEVSGTLSVSSGSVLTINVGSGGSTGASRVSGTGGGDGGLNPLEGFNGGRGGHAGSTGSSGAGGGGGAATVVDYNGVRYVAAGGGGSGGGNNIGPSAEQNSKSFSAGTTATNGGIGGTTSGDGGGGGGGGGGNVGGVGGLSQKIGSSTETYGFGGHAGSSAPQYIEPDSNNPELLDLLVRW